LSSGQQSQFRTVAKRVIYLFQNVHYQRRKGVVDDEFWAGWVTSLDEFVGQQGFQDVLATTRPHLGDPFQASLDSRMAQTAD
jgi:hypothetical protein